MSRWLLLAVLAYLILVPLGMLLFSSFRDTTNRLPFEATPWTLSNYSNVFTSGSTYRVLGISLGYAAGSLALAFLIVLPLAFLLERTDFPMQRTLRLVVLAPLGLPAFVGAMAWILLAESKIGLINLVLRYVFGITSGEGPFNIYSIGGMIFVTGLLFVPSIYLMISGTFTRFDPAFEESSATSGASFLTTLRRITVPLLSPSILGAAVFFMIVGIEAFEVPAFIGIPGGIYTLSTRVYYLVNPPTGGLPAYGVAAAFGVVTLIVAGALVVAYRRVLGDRSRFVTVGSRGFRPELIKLRPWPRRLAVSGVGLYALIAIVLPILVLLWESLLPNYADFSISSLKQLTFSAYSQVFSDPSTGSIVVHTVVMASVSAVLIMALASLTAWFALRDRSRGFKVAEFVLFASVGIPSVIVAVSIGLLYLWLHVGIYGTIWILVLAMAARYIPYGTTVMTPALMQVGRDLEDASTMCGASQWQTLRRILFPLIWPSFARGMLWTFIQAARDATIVVLLLSIGNVTIGSDLYQTWASSANLSYACALSILLVIVSSALTLLVLRFDSVARRPAG
ncbi:MAG TPA: iron ABC transporter permease [Solirubrobacteraceae bacterium]|nr:iron ABC transporter permease [Solirubrobacteraceae bacterium]